MKLIEGRRKIYDGLETQELYDTVFAVYDHAFPVKEMLKNSFTDLKERLSESDFLELTNTEHYGIQYAPFDGIDYYKSAEGLTLYYRVLNDDLLYVFSFGEVQPARYQLYAEGVWRIPPSHRFQGNMGEPDTVSSFVMMFGTDPRTMQLPIKNLKQLHDTLVAKGCNHFYIAAENTGGPQDTNVDVLDFRDGNWIVYHSDQRDQPFFSTTDQDEAMVFYYKQIRYAD